jgi:Inosine-uridine nucleoside N-ribohydrolase
MGIRDCDVDDGLALIYLLGKEKIDLCGITATYGNSNVEAVYANTAAMLQELGRQDIPLFKGCARQSSLEANCRDNEAARFLAETAKAHPGQISILATGSLTNLYAAYQRDDDFFGNVKEIVLMGGITEPLYINDRILNELNFSCDPAAAGCVLRQGYNVSIITGNNCLKAYFTEAEFRSRLELNEELIARYIYRKCGDWFRTMMQKFTLDGFHNWDVTAAAYLAEPSLFNDHLYMVDSGALELPCGFLQVAEPDAAGGWINLPEIGSLEDFKEDIYRSWLTSKCSMV